MSAIKKFEVTSDGIARIPKSTPVPVAASSSLGSADGDVPMVRRLDGTWEALPSRINNPNFAPRQAHPGGKIVTNDKDEVHGAPQISLEQEFWDDFSGGPLLGAIFG